MISKSRQKWTLSLFAAAAVLAYSATTASAEPRTVRVAKQFGISYLPLSVMEEKGLIEAEGKKLGLDLKTEWLRFTGGPPMNEAIVSGNLDFASGGVGPLVTAWARTQKNIKIKGIAAINAMPLFLNTIKPEIKTIKDFTEKDRIALPAVKVSIQAVVLQMAAEKVFGKGQEHKLDQWTVSLSHPDAFAQMMSGKSEITAHLTSAPYQYEELKDKRVHKVLDSYEVLGGPHTFNSIWATAKLYEGEPKVIQAFLAALEEAMKYIKADPDGAAKLWVKNNNSKLPVEEAARIIKLPENEWTMTPKKTMAFADYMSRVGMIPVKPESWKDLYVKNIHNLPGS
ncbi:MAG TPA: ABC transporter substrate-binding protein [Xanthobacteraceae bacterium]|jgi:NitT/TauT family transport system substrate-binding protein|nr:ABC transporter substrate-binding protein [Xanthobacteraceae bacterium]